jgi:uncharacterized protein YutE (UPF0331/DUF86 family)
MTPSGLREKVVAERVAWVRDMALAIRGLPLSDYDGFLADRRNVAAAESYLRRALEALMDLGRHVLAKGFGMATPEYRDIPVRLTEVHVLSVEDAEVMGRMARYRNRMVHFYQEVSARELYEICTRHLDEVEHVTSAMTAWVNAHPELIDRSL